MKERSNFEDQIKLLQEWVKANTRRIEELETTTFQLSDEEEIILITLQKRE